MRQDGRGEELRPLRAGRVGEVQREPVGALRDDREERLGHLGRGAGQPDVGHRSHVGRRLQHQAGREG